MSLSFCLVCLVPVLPALAGVASRWLPRELAVLACTWAGVGSLMLSLVNLASVAFGAHSGGDLRLLEALLCCLASFLGFVVLRFSRSYLDGDPQQGRFFANLSLALAGALGVIVSNNLLLLGLCWTVVSLAMNGLLLHHSERPGAHFAARKKFVLSRFADASIAAAVILAWYHYGTTELSELSRSLEAGNTGPLGMILGLLLLAAALRTAQVPFHGWLPETMEAPTPVSAFMHAGVVNAGGIVMLRLSPWLSHFEGIRLLLVIVGCASAVVGAIAMLPQTSVKRSLAYSTIAQMGFLFVEIGLGAYALALLHLAAHSAYKAYAFLNAGSVLGDAPRTAVRLKPGALAIGAVAGWLAATFGHHILKLAGFPEVQVSIFQPLLMGSAVGYGVARLISSSSSSWAVPKALGLAVGFTALATLLHSAALLLIPTGELQAVPPSLWVPAVACFSLLALFQVFLWRLNRYAWGRRFYVHAMNGFYVVAFSNRLLARLWPNQTVSS